MYFLHVEIALRDNFVIAILSFPMDKFYWLNCLKLQGSIHGFK